MPLEGSDAEEATERASCASVRAFFRLFRLMAALEGESCLLSVSLTMGGGERPRSRMVTSSTLRRSSGLSDSKGANRFTLAVATTVPVSFCWPPRGGVLLEVSLGRGAAPLGLDERAGLVAAFFALWLSTWNLCS